MSGADFFSLTNKARHEALKRMIKNREKRTDFDEEEIYIKEEDFLKSVTDLKPTLNESEFNDYIKYFENYSNKS